MAVISHKSTKHFDMALIISQSSLFHIIIIHYTISYKSQEKSWRSHLHTSLAIYNWSKISSFEKMSHQHKITAFFAILEDYTQKGTHNICLFVSATAILMDTFELSYHQLFVYFDVPSNLEECQIYV